MAGDAAEMAVMVAGSVGVGAVEMAVEVTLLEGTEATEAVTVDGWAVGWAGATVASGRPAAMCGVALRVGFGADSKGEEDGANGEGDEPREGELSEPSDGEEDELRGEEAGLAEGVMEWLGEVEGDDMAEAASTDGCCEVAWPARWAADKWLAGCEAAD